MLERRNPQVREQRQIDSLESRVKDCYISYDRNVFYPNGEIDFLGLYLSGMMDIYEVKSSYKAKSKGIQQLQRAKKYYYNITKGLYLYIAREDRIITVWERLGK